MLKIYKKDARIDDFLIDKIYTSLEKAGDASGVQMNQGEINLIARDIEKTILGIRGQDGLTSVYEVRAIVTKVLRDMGYKQIAKAYYDYQ